MKVFQSINEMQAWSLASRRKGKTIAFVPTMGGLHEGHATLLRQGKKTADRLVLSLFVNPIQFGPKEDFKNYPRPVEKDLKQAKNCGVDVVFLPTAEIIYPKNFQTFVHLENLTKRLCGLKRPGHFRGVATVVLKLFHIVQPDIALFGKKDYQQLRVIEQMVADLNLQVQIVPIDIVREKDGLAMSSRNHYLSPSERKIAVRLSQGLQEIQKWIDGGEIAPPKLENRFIDFLTKEKKITIDYVTICDPITLEPLKKLKSDSLLAIACFVGQTRLIDNVILKRKNIKNNFSN